MSLLDQIEVQPSFPSEDLTDVNASFMSVVLASRDVLNRFHDRAWRAFPLFVGTHKPLWLSVEEIFDDPRAQRATNYGIIAFESIHLMVSADAHTINQGVLQANIANILNPEKLEGVRDYFMRAYSVFKQDMPRTTGAIAEASSRFYDSSRTYQAVFGAAICREFIRDNTN